MTTAAQSKAADMHLMNTHPAAKLKADRWEAADILICQFDTCSGLIWAADTGYETVQSFHLKTVLDEVLKRQLTWKYDDTVFY
jgi:hypothetical protein